MYTHLVAWLVVAMHAWGARPEPAEGTVAAADLEDRYSALAEDFVSVAFDPDEAPVYGGPGGRVRTQIHAGPFGIELVGGKARQCTRRGRDCITANELARDTELQARVALHILRTQGLAGYCGERGGEGEHSLARRAPAEAWYRDHPLDADVAELAAE